VHNTLQTIVECGQDSVRALLSLLLIPLLLLSSACSLFAPPSQSINIVPSNPNASVFVDGNLVGKGPQSVRLSKSDTHSVMAKCGNSAGTGMVDRELSTTGILDIIGGCLLLVPFIGLVAPGSHELSPSTLSVGIPDESSCQQQADAGVNAQPAPTLPTAPTPLAPSAR